MSRTSSAARVLIGPTPGQGRAAPSRPPAARLRVVASAPAGSPVRPLVLSAGLLLVGLLVLLLLNIALGKGAYQLSQLQREQAIVEEQRQGLSEQVLQLSSPQRLATRARQLGMVPAPNAAFVEVPGGDVVGVQAQATAPPRPTPRSSPVAKQSGAAKPSSAAKPSGAAKPSAPARRAATEPSPGAGGAQR